MAISGRVIWLGTVLVSGFLPTVALCGQNPPVPAVAASSSSNAPAIAGQGAKPPQPVPAGVLQQEELTGNWGGLRDRWKDKGVVLDSSLTQFYQGVSSGGTETGSAYNGTLQLGLDFDFGKLGGWQYWSAEFKSEMRFADPLLLGTGSINPVNTAAIIPAASETKATVSALNLTRLFPINLKEGKLFALSFGRYNLVDLLDEEFFAGSGIKRFFNMAQIGPLTVLRQVPLITNGISMAYIRGGVPFVTLALIDPNDHSLDIGIDDLFADGITFSPGINFSTKHFGKSGKHTFGAAITTKEYTPFDAIRQAIIPGPPLNPVEPQRGSWSINYVVRQYIVERAPKDGWGLFGQVSFADSGTSPITTFFDIGLGGNGLFAGRARDEFGVSYAYTDLSEELKDNLDLPILGVQRLRAEHQFEFFYNLHLTPWLQLTGDLQILRPNRPDADTAIVPGGRLRIVF